MSEYCVNVIFERRTSYDESQKKTINNNKNNNNSNNDNSNNDNNNNICYCPSGLALSAFCQIKSIV